MIRLTASLRHSTVPARAIETAQSIWRGRAQWRAALANGDCGTPTWVALLVVIGTVFAVSDPQQGERAIRHHRTASSFSRTDTDDGRHGPVVEDTPRAATDVVVAAAGAPEHHARASLRGAPGLPVAAPRVSSLHRRLTVRSLSAGHPAQAQASRRPPGRAPPLI